MKARRARKAVKKFPNLSRFASYEQLKSYSVKYGRNWTGEQNWTVLERMRQLRCGYKPGELKMDNSVFHTLTMVEFRKESEREYEEEIRKYGPR